MGGELPAMVDDVEVSTAHGTITICVSHRMQKVFAKLIGFVINVRAIWAHGVRGSRISVATKNKPSPATPAKKAENSAIAEFSALTYDTKPNYINMLKWHFYCSR
jgi:hypothetical protein